MLCPSWLRRLIPSCTIRQPIRSRPRSPRRTPAPARLLLEALEDRTLPSATVLPATAPAALQSSYGQLPLTFVANEGQAAAGIDYVAQGAGYSVSLSAQQALVSLTPTPTTTGPPPASTTVALQLVGANPSAHAVGADPLITKVNYLTSSVPGQSLTNIPTVGQVEYLNVYQGVDATYSGNQGQLETTFTVQPGADAGVIRLRVQGAQGLSLDANGDLVIQTTGGNVVEQTPVLYQEINGVKEMVSGHYVLEGNNTVGFQIGAYDHSQALVIDPTLSYSTYLGSSTATSYAIAVDSSGDAYVGGGTAARGNGQLYVEKLNAAGTAVIYQTYLGSDGFIGSIAVNSAGDAYVTGYGGYTTTANALSSTGGGFFSVLNATGSGLLYSTGLPGTAQSSNFIQGPTGAIAVDSLGNAYLTGEAGSGLLTTPGAYESSGSGAFLMKIDPNLSGSASLLYGSYLGGTLGTGIAVDSSGNAYIVGTGNAPTTPGAFQQNPGGDENVFVAKFDPALTGSASLVYSTLLGGNGDSGYISGNPGIGEFGQTGPGIAVDSAGDAYVVGSTMATNFPTTAGAFDTTYDGPVENTLAPSYVTDGDAFVTKLNPTGTGLIYSTYLGGSARDGASSIALDAAGDAYVTGWTDSTNFPNQNPIQAQKVTGTDANGLPNSDVFVTTLNSTGSGLLFSTYLGGSGDDYGEGIALDAANNIYVTGTTGHISPSSNFPTTPGALQTTPGGGFVFKITPVVAADSLSVTGFPSTTTAGVGGTVTVTAKGANGNVLTGYTGTVHFTSSDPQAVLPANYTFTAADQGVHTFNVTLDTAGTQSLTATDTTAGFLGSESGITVNPAAASTLGVTGFPTPNNVGIAGSFTVTALDPYGNKVTGYTGTVQFSSSPGSATLPGNYTFTAADNGAHTFSATFGTAGTQSLTATDTVTGSITGSQTGITVNPASLPAASLSVTGFPSTTTAGTAATITVTARDANGNVASSYRGTVKFSSSDQQAGLPANYTFTNADQGVHTFSVILKTAGTQSLTATDTATGSITGSETGIVVSPATVSTFRISAPASVSPGTAFSVTVTALDAYGNVVTGYTGTVTFSSTDGKAILPANYTFKAANDGVYTFVNKTTLKTKGTQTLYVADTLTGAEGSANISVT